MARFVTKVGCVFSAKLDEQTKRYFQHIANDKSQLGSNVIRVFKTTYPIDANPKLSDIIKDDVDFYAHCILKWGFEQGLWEKIGNISDFGMTDIIFRGTSDYGRRVGEEPIVTSQNWYIWRINEKREKVGTLQGENKKAEIGLVVNPMDIIHRIKTGKYSFDYPGY